uniref:type IV secretion system protein n=1 Tax=Vibrio parahaemolyticus TaxID=670 RepID=UPI0039C9913F
MWTWKSKTRQCAAPTQDSFPQLAQTQISQAFKEENPFERAARELVKVDIKSTLPLSDNTWQMEWVETITDRQGTYSIRRALKPPSPPKPSNPKTKRR